MTNPEEESSDPVVSALARFSATLDRLADGLEASVRLQEVQRLRTDHVFDILNERRPPSSTGPAGSSANARPLSAGNPPLLPTPAGAETLVRRQQEFEQDRAPPP